MVESILFLDMRNRRVSLCNLHISLTAFKNESRVLKETYSLIHSGLVDYVHIVALHEEGLKEKEEIDNKRDIWRVKLTSRLLPKSLIFQLAKYVEFSIRVLVFSRRKKVKLINVHSLGLLPIGWAVKLITGGKLIYDAHELETETNGLRGFRKSLSKYVEKLLIRKIDLTIVVGGEIERWYQSNYVGLPIVTVMNCSLYREQVSLNKLRSALSVPENYKIVLYQGGLCSGRGVEFLLEAFKSLKASKYSMVFMGYGELESEIKEAAKSSPHIYFMPAVSPDEVLDYTASADIGMSLVEDACLSYRYCLPNKLFEYIIVRVPVIVSNLPEMKRVVNECRIGEVLNDWSPQSLISALEKLEIMPTDEREENLNEAANQFNWEVQEKKMINAYEKYVFGSQV